MYFTYVIHKFDYVRLYLNIYCEKSVNITSQNSSVNKVIGYRFKYQDLI